MPTTLPGIGSIIIGASASGGSSAPHLYWRVLAADNWGGSGIVIREVEFLDSGGSVIPATGGTAIASDDSVGFEASKAFDGTSTAWYADAASTDQWIGYHYPSAKSVGKVRITNDGGYDNALGRSPKNCSLQYSDDGSSWSTAFTFVHHSLFDCINTYPENLAAGYHHMWRLFCQDNNGWATLIVVGEVELRATAGGADQTTAISADAGDSSNRALASSEAVGNDAWRAWGDDGAVSCWAGTSTTNEYIGIMLSTAIKVEEIAVTSGNTSHGDTRAPNQMHLDYSDDGGATWVTQKTFASQTGWGFGETRVLTAI